MSAEPAVASDVPVRTGASLPTAASPWSALPVVIAGSLMVILDFFIVNVALPPLAADLSASSGEIEWIVASYALMEAVFLITAGRIGDNLGRRRLYVWGVALFTLASAACAAAPSAEVLIAARLAQGLAGGILMPQVLAIIGVEFEGADRVKAMGIYSMAMGISAVSAQLIGGALVELDLAGLSWRACFLINLPIGLCAIALAPRLVPESRAPRPVALDPLGVVLLTLGLAAITLPLIEGREQGWPLWTWLSFVAAALLLGGFIAHQRRARVGRPHLLDLSLFRDRAFSGGMVAQLIFWSGQAAFFIYLALYLQSGRGLEPLGAGLVFTIAAFAYVIAAGAAPKLIERFGVAVLALGGLVLAAGHGAMTIAVAEIGVDGSIAALAPGLALIGAGMGLCLTAINASVLATLDDQRAGSASGVLATFQALGNALGVAITGVIFFATVDRGIDDAFVLSAAQLTAIGIAIAIAVRLIAPRVDTERMKEAAT